MPLNPPTSISAAAPVVRPVPPKEILWPTFPGHGNNPNTTDSSVFPSRTAMKARSGAVLPAPLEAFTMAAWAAQDRILVLDDFLFTPINESQQQRYDQILSWLPIGLVANDIRFLTSPYGDAAERTAVERLFKDRAAKINQSSPHRSGLVSVEIKFASGLFGYVHDRFAIIDNELWHFGATVGGLHSQLNAATRGWDASAHNALLFFEDAWKGESNTSLGRKHG